jgi:hypothetical protein
VPDSTWASDFVDITRQRHEQDHEIIYFFPQHVNGHVCESFASERSRISIRQSVAFAINRRYQFLNDGAAKLQNIPSAMHDPKERVEEVKHAEVLNAWMCCSEVGLSQGMDTRVKGKVHENKMGSGDDGRLIRW